nr:hypothetical protein [Georgenia thermotolerans]
MFGSRGKAGAWGGLGPQGVYVVAADPATVDAAFEGVRDLDGVAVLRPPHATDYDARTFDVRDGDGNLWAVGTYLGA